jgi:hypothetical protein
MRSHSSLPPESDRVSRRRGAVSVAGALAMGLLVSAGTTPHYSDDTHGSLVGARQVVQMRGEQGFNRVKFAPPAGASSAVLDARYAVFIVGNSRNPQPTAVADCDHGALPVNRYPLLIEQEDHTAFVGGLFLSRVPQASEWRATYCNSAAITFESSASGVVDGVRITGAWDGIRVGRASPNLTIVNSWISNARDDAVENDFLQPAIVRDTLIDGAFQGISVKPRKTSDTADASGQTVTLSGVLLRLGEYRYKEGRRFGALLKSDQRAPRFRVVNSVVAVDYEGGQSYPQYWATSWAKLAASSNNLFLWLSDAPVPDFVPLPPASFRMLRGQAARDAWTRAKTNWINCHPKLARLPSDPRSNPDRCVPGTWGGFTD